ncbi:hypothetical protein OO013_17585 [Mangrovivirga sp. M17]|uniref:Uncharacterized protein n=1 Tax=Mangrovivirga halotolerans TaxID=2993936 RepID=A0ABT3RVA7_9BACT|nr:hypothetical protein [Mangrovivirga halotolerans]MCX2745699.1 hypothetical protein [Mangrovivirga halotolerans]
MNYKPELHTRIIEFESGVLSPDEFHDYINSLIPLITENHESILRERIENLEADIELIDFTVNSIDRRAAYLKRITSFKNELN